MNQEQIDTVFEYQAPTPEQIERMKNIRETAKTLAEVILENCPASADRTVAIRKVREAVMVANASIVLNGMV